MNSLAWLFHTPAVSIVIGIIIIIIIIIISIIYYLSLKQLSYNQNRTKIDRLRKSKQS